MAERSNTGLVVLVLGGLYLLSKPKSAPSSGADSSAAAGPAPAGGASSPTKTAGGGSVVGDVIKAGAALAKPIGAAASAIGAVAGVGAPAVIGGAAFIAAGAGLGYIQDGPVGAVIGGLNPITGNLGLLGASGGKAVAGAAGFNDWGTDASEASGALLGGLATLADIATVAALLPTLVIATLFADLLGAIFGSDPPSPPTPQQRVDGLYQIALGPDGQYSWLRNLVGPQDQINAMAQLVALSNGPANLAPQLYPGEPPKAATPGQPGAQPNPLRAPARGRAAQLGLEPLFDDAPPTSGQPVGSPKHGAHS